MQKIIIIGPAHPLRGGGMVTFNQRLAKEFNDSGFDCSIVSFSLQYPSIFFPGKTQKTNEPAPKSLHIRSLINSINPINWILVGNKIKNEKPDLIIVRFWIPVLGLALGTILRIIKKNRISKIVCIADNIIPHEKRIGDKFFTTYFLKNCDAFITMSEQVENDLKLFENSKPSKLEPHPLYDNFGAAIEKQVSRAILKIEPTEKIILFFGFIRAYKGLDILLEAMADEQIKKSNIKLLIAGEFYEEENKYKKIIQDLNISKQVILHTNFIPDEQVRNYFCAADAVIQPYKSATQSGVTPLAYYFEKPMIVTNVGGLPHSVPHEKVGLVTFPNAKSLTDAIIHFYALGENHFIPHLRQEKIKYSWSNMVNAIMQLAKNV